jgi:hypothetical protein
VAVAEGKISQVLKNNLYWNQRTRPQFVQRRFVSKK